MGMLTIMGLYQYDDTIFDSIVLPAGVDKNTMISSILLECSELETFISDPDIMKQALGYWSNKNLDNWTHINEALRENYDPLWNKDGTFTETENRDLKSTGTSTGQVSAFNTESFRNQSRQDASGTDSGTIIRTRRETGNIGVTTSQQMLTEEVNLRRQFNIYDFITEDFKSRFCLMVY